MAIILLICGAIGCRKGRPAVVVAAPATASGGGEFFFGIKERRNICKSSEKILKKMAGNGIGFRV